jgi:uncharacterized protein YqgC (DUF456 family)
MLGVIGLLAAASYAVDFVAGALGVKRIGASPRAMVGAGLGTLLGLVFGLPGLIVGPFMCAVLGELSGHRDLRRAGRAGVAAWIGFLVGAVSALTLLTWVYFNGVDEASGPQSAMFPPGWLR